MATSNWPKFRAAAVDELCRTRGVTRSEIARLAGIRPSTIHWWLRGQVQPQYETVLRLCAAFALDPAFFAEGLHNEPTEGAVCVETRDDRGPVERRQAG